MRGGSTTGHEETGEVVLPAGTEISAILSCPLGTRASEIGDGVRAVVRGPVRAPSGGIVLADGAELRGRIASTGRRGARPRLAVAFETVETVAGPLPFSARIVAALPYARVERGVLGPPGGDVESEVLVPAGADVRLALVEPLVVIRV